MGFSSSPAFGPAGSTGRRVVRVSSKHATPELPLLEEAATELAALDEFQLLPASAVDTEGFGAAWTPVTAIPPSPEEAEEGSSSASDDWTPDAREGEASLTFAPPAAAVEAAALVRDGEPPAEEMPASDLQAIEVAGQIAPGSYVPMWCRALPAGDGQTTMIVPVADGWMDLACLQPEHVAHGVTKLWCWVQQDTSGQVMVVPCLATEADVLQHQGHLYDSTDAVLHAIGEATAAEPSAPAWSGGQRQPCGATTLCIEGLPAAMTQEEFLEVLDREDCSGLYDFVFLPAPGPSDRKALVNFSMPSGAAALADRLQGRCRVGGQDAAAGGCQASLSRAPQGLDALVAAFSDSPENAPEVREELRPQLFEGGWPKPVPAGRSRP